MGAVISCAKFAMDDTYEVFIGGTLNGSDVGGVYDAESITAYSDGVQQGYTGTDVRRGPGGFGGGAKPEGMEFPEGMKFPEGMEKPQGGGRPNMPEGMDHPEMPEGMEPPEGMGFPEDNMKASGELRYEFYMQDKVNNFSGLADKKAE